MRLSRKRGAAAAVAEWRRLVSDETSLQARVEFLTRAVAKFPMEPELRVSYADCLSATQPAEARREALVAAGLEAIEGDAMWLTRLAGLLLSLGEPEAADSCAERATAAAPAEFFLFACELARIRGLLAVHQGKDEKGERLLRDAHELDPTDELAAQALAAYLADRRRFGEALEVIARTLGTPARDGRDRSRLRELREEFRRRRGPGIRVAPAGSSSTSLAGEGRQAATDSAEPEVERAPSPTPRRADSTSERLARSLRLLKLDMATKDPARLVPAARGFVDMGMRDAARLCLERAAQGKPSDSTVLQQLDAVRGAIALLDGDHALAERMLRAAHKADPTDPVAVSALCALLGGQGRHTEALELVNAALAQASREQTDSSARDDLERARRQVETSQPTSKPTVSFSAGATSTIRLAPPKR